MEEISNFVTQLLANTITAVFTSLYKNWLPLSLAILTAAAMKAYVNTEKLKQALLRKPNVSISASVAFGAFTPLCACGTMAVVIGLFTTTLPWGPIMAFLTSSPLMSPDAFILLAGIVSVRFATALAVASIIIGLGSGYLTNLIEKKTDFLKNQTRFSAKTQTQICVCSEPVPTPVQACGCSGGVAAAEETNRNISEYKSSFSRLFKKMKMREMAEALLNVGLKQILLYFSIFVGIGYLIQSFVPTSLIMALFSPDSIFSVPLAALMGLPLYVSGESAIPLINALLAGGAGGGAMLAFMITGQATSAWVIAGITVFMKRRVIGLYLAFILAGGILLGYLYDLFLAVGI